LARKLYSITISYDFPTVNVGQMPAESEEHARALLTQAHAGMKNFEIIDCYEIGELPQLELPLEEPEVWVESDKKVVN